MTEDDTSRLYSFHTNNLSEWCRPRSTCTPPSSPGDAGDRLYMFSESWIIAWADWNAMNTSGQEEKWASWSCQKKKRKRKKLNCMAHTTQLRGMASTLRMRTAISPEQWQPWTKKNCLKSAGAGVQLIGWKRTGRIGRVSLLAYA